MNNISNEFRNQLYRDNRNYLLFANITLADGTSLTIENKDIWENGFKIEDSTSGDSCFDIGASIINKFVLTLNNIYEEFSKYDFKEAVVSAQIGLSYNGKIEKVQKGIYTVDEAEYNGAVISLECLDNMSKFEKPYSLSSLPYPATIGEIIRDACECCGIALVTSVFDGSTQVVNERPSDDALTFLQIIAWCAQRCCKFARCDEYGRLEIGWYDIETYESMDELNGGNFDEGSPYKSGEDADGGDFNDYLSGSDYDAGEFEKTKKFHHIFSTSTLNVSTDDVVITGVEVTVNEEHQDGIYKYGKEGYVLAIKDNKLINAADGQMVADYVGSRIVGLRFRPFSAACLSDPSIEAGDPCYITDRKQNTYKSFITRHTFQTGGYQSVQCSAETPSRNKAVSYSEMTKAIVEARRNAEKQISYYDETVRQMTQLISQGFGMYFTKVEQSDGSIVWCMHDKPTVEESDYVCKLTSNGIVASKDGGTTWAVDKNGNALFNVLSVVGFYFDWAKGGTLTLGGLNDENGIMKVLNKDGGYVLMDGNGLQHYSSGNKTYYHYLNKTGAVVIEGDKFNSVTYKATESIVLPSEFKGKDITFVPYVQGYVLVDDGEMYEHRTALSKLAMSVDIDKKTAIVTLIVECRVLHFGNTVGGTIYAEYYSSPLSITIAYTAIA